MKVKNKKCIRRLSWLSLWASRKRNIIAITAIALTTLLFTSLFTIVLSINSSYEEFTFRQIGGYNHGTFKDVTGEKVEVLSTHRKVKDYGLRVTVGFMTEAPFAKTQAEISWMDDNTAKWSYATPTTGRIPESGMEIAMDTEALRKLGIPAELGEQVEITYILSDGSGSITASEERTDVFTLVGFWEYDALMPVHYINISEEYMRKAEDSVVNAGGEKFRMDMNVMLPSSLNIREVMESIDRDLGFQWENRDAENCVRVGVNWGYTTAEFAASLDPAMLVAMVAVLLLIIFTGYLIIYNIFQISVSNDIRFYGLLKTIGTTPKQVKRMIRWQAVYLSTVGIPIGCVAGYGVGAVLTPKVIATSNLSTVKLSTSPLIFIFAALFALITVFLSCSRPGKKAADITPVEAVRYTENACGHKKKRAIRGAKVWQMAVANLGRNRLKTTLVILSLSLAVVLLNCVFMFTQGFDEEKYVNSFSATDFTVGTTDYFGYRGMVSTAALSEETITDIQSNTNASLAGSAYVISDKYSKGWLTEEEYRGITGVTSEDMWQQIREGSMKREDFYAADVLLQGMDVALLDKLIVFDGSLQPLKEQNQPAIAVAANQDENGNVYGNPKKVGDTITITYVDEGHYYDSRTGQIATEDTPEECMEYRIIKSHDVTYTVCALVGIPYGMSHRFMVMNGFEAVITSEALMRDSALALHRMFYVFDTPDEVAETAAEKFLSEYTAADTSQIMYESKALLRAEFENFRKMFLVVGMVLCIIVGFVGILNFFNAIMTSILACRREFAVLQSVGMTNKQLKNMLVYEGLFYALSSAIVALILSVVFNPLVGSLLEKMFWFFRANFTITPVLITIPVFALLGWIIPSVMYGQSMKQSIVERLRENE